MSDGDAGRDDAPADELRERAPGGRWRLWLLLDANRWTVAGVTLLVVFVTLVVLGELHPVGAKGLFVASDPLETLFQGLLTSIVTGVTLVVTVSQLALSQELGGVGDQRERMQEATGFRRDTADAIGLDAAPPEPSAFLRALVEATGERANALADAVEAVADDEYEDRVKAYAADVAGNADAVDDRLTDAQFGEFAVVRAALDYNYSWKVYAARRLRAERDDLPEEVETAFADLLDALVLFGPAREHFKTLYFRWELTDLSRVMLYAAIPALVTAVAGIVYLDASVFTGTIFGVRTLLLVVCAATTVSIAPFALLLAYVLRIVTVTKRTLSVGPFILRESERSVDLDD